jgi:hypothetical protein
MLVFGNEDGKYKVAQVSDPRETHLLYEDDKHDNAGHFIHTYIHDHDISQKTPRVHV